MRELRFFTARRTRLYGACVVAGVVGLWVAPAAHAGLAVTPSRVVRQATPGQKLVGTWLLENRTEDMLQVDVQPEDWAAGMSGSRGVVPWLVVRPTQLALRPGKRAHVTYLIRVPKDASGELRAQVFFAMPTKGAVAVRSRIGAIVYVVVKDTEQIDGAITHVEVSYAAGIPGVEAPDALSLTIRVKNLGNVHIVPYGEVVIRDQQGQTVGTIPVEQGWGLLPQEEEDYRATGAGIYLKPGSYAMEIRLTCGDDLDHPVILNKVVQAVVSDQYKLELLDAAAPATP